MSLVSLPKWFEKSDQYQILLNHQSQNNPRSTDLHYQINKFRRA